MHGTQTHARTRKMILLQIWIQTSLVKMVANYMRNGQQKVESNLSVKCSCTGNQMRITLKDVFEVVNYHVIECKNVYCFCKEQHNCK